MREKKREACVVINLADRKDRRVAMEGQLRRIRWKADFFPAIRPDDRGDFPSIGSRGCFMSHLAVLRDARDRNLERLIIVEDDLNFAPDFEQLRPKYADELSKLPWSMVYPGHILRNTRPGLNLLTSSTPVQCTHFLAINGTAIARVVHGLEQILARPSGHPLGGPMHVDGAYSTIRSQNTEIMTYSISPALGYQRSSRTDIGHLKWFDKIAQIRPIVSVARRAKSVIWR